MMSSKPELKDNGTAKEKNSQENYIFISCFIKYAVNGFIFIFLFLFPILVLLSVVVFMIMVPKYGSAPRTMSMK